MAVETERRVEPVAVEPTAQRARVRLHEEILPPRLDQATPVLIRNARRALAILAAGMILIQLISAPIGHRLNAIARSGTDPYSIWEHYASNPVPDVLVIGASSARSDVDEAALSAELSTAAGHTVTVGKMGFAGQTPLFLDALMYRVMSRPQHPKLIVVVVVGPELSDGCAVCINSVYRGLWDISDLTDVGFIRKAVGVSPNPAWLATGWVLPSVAYYPSVIAVQCLAYEYGRAGATTFIGTVPRQLQDPTYCEGTIPYKWARQPAMTQVDYESSVQNYRDFMTNYHVSPDAVASVTDIVSSARAAGTNTVFLQIPLHQGIRNFFSGEVQESKLQLMNLASRLNMDVVDFSASVPDDPSLWVDGMHLDKAGADYLSPRLATALAPMLGG
jgi:hypothetical protein